MMTAAGSEEVAVQAMKLGAAPDVAAARITPELRARRRAAGLVGESLAFLGAVELAGRAASTDATVLLDGETGTGKEMFVRAINCAAVPESVLESELFGDIRGAFSGADRDNRGPFEEASGGTLFLASLRSAKRLVSMEGSSR
jgi:two-component system NtrC family response regulator